MMHTILCGGRKSSQKNKLTPNVSERQRSHLCRHLEHPTLFAAPFVRRRRQSLPPSCTLSIRSAEKRRKGPTLFTSSLNIDRSNAYDANSTTNQKIAAARLLP